MATYAEIVSITADPSYLPLVDKITVAVAIKAQAIAVLASPTSAQITWAKQALSDPRSQADQIIHYVIAANVSATNAQILGASDASIQSAVNDAVDKLLSL